MNALFLLVFGLLSGCYVSSEPRMTATDFSGVPEMAKVGTDLGTDLGAVPNRVVIEYQDINGQRLATGWYDTALNVKCSAALTVNGLRCIPDEGSLAFVSGFVDSLCTRFGVLVRSGCIAPKYVQTMTGSCSEVHHVYTVITSPATYYNLSLGVCLLGTVPVGYNLYATGIEIDSSNFASISVIH